MIRKIYHFVRADLGGISLGLGCLGLLLLLFTVPATFFGAHFFGGLGFKEGPRPTPDQLDAAVSHEFWWSVWHRLVPQLAISLALLGYGLYEAHMESKSKP